MTDEEELDFQPVKEIKADILNEAFIFKKSERKQKKSLNFYIAEANISKPEQNINQNLAKEYDNLAQKEYPTNKMQRGRRPQVTWEEVSSPPKGILGSHEDLPKDIVPSCLPKDLSKSSNISSFFHEKEEDNLIDESLINTPVLSKLPSSKLNGTVSSMVREKNEERTPTRIHFSNNEKITLKSKSQNHNLNDRIVTSSETGKLKENKENEIHNHKTDLHRAEFVSDKKVIYSPKQQNDYIRSWRKMESLASKQHGPKPSVTQMLAGANVSKRKSSLEGGCQKKDIEVDNAAAEEYNGLSYSKRQKVTNEGLEEEDVNLQPNSPDKHNDGSPCKVRHYDRDSVQKYMLTQKMKRRKANRMAVKRKEDEKKKIEAHLKNLETARFKDPYLPVPLPRHKIGLSSHSQENPLSRKKFDAKEPPLNLTKYSENDADSNMVEVGVQCTGTNVEIEILDPSRKKEAAAAFTATKHLTADNGFEKIIPKRSKKNKSDRKSTSQGFRSPESGGSVTDIVSRALQECEDKLKGSVISASETEEPDVASDASSAVEIKVVPSSRKERIAALHEMAQRLSKTIEIEELSLDKTFQIFNNKLTPLNPSKSSRNTTDVPPSGSTTHKKDRPLSLAEIKAMSLEELMARMTATLPKSSAKEVTPQTLEGETRVSGVDKIFTNQPLEEVDRSNSKMQSHTHGREQNRASDSYNLEFVPAKELNGSFFDPKKIATPHPERTSRLTDLRPPLLSFGADESFLNSHHNLFFLPQSYSSLEIHAATIIQAYFRGYRVRKKTSLKLASKIRKRKFQKLLEANVPPLIEPTISHTLLNSNVYIPEPKTEVNIVRNDRDLYYLGKELDKRSQIVLPPPEPMKTKHLSLPKYVQPFFELRETGDIDAFISSCPNLKEITRNPSTSHDRKFIEDNASTQAKNFHFGSSSPKIESLFPDKPLPNLNSFSKNKETQTVPTVKKNDFDRDTYSQKMNKSSEEIDLKRFCNNDRLYKKHSNTSHPFKGAPLGHLISTESLAKLTKYELNVDRANKVAGQNRTSASCYSNVSEVSPIYSSFIENSQEGNHSSLSPLDVSFSEKFSSKNSEQLEDISFLHVTSESSRIERFEENWSHTNVLPQGYQFSPSNLSMKVTTELAYQDTIGSALNHLQDLENLRALSQAQARSSNLSGPFTHSTACGKALDEELRRVKEENDSLKRIKQEAEVQQETQFKADVQRLEKEVHSRFLKFEHDMRKKTEHLIESVTRTSHPDHGAIASATAAAVGASIKAIRKFTQSSSKRETSSQSDTSSAYSQDFVEASFEDTLHSRVSDDNLTSSKSGNGSKTISHPYEENTGDEVLTVASLDRNDVENSPSIKESREYTPYSTASVSGLLASKLIEESKSTEFGKTVSSSTTSVSESLNHTKTKASTTASSVSLPENIKISEEFSAYLKSNSSNKSSSPTDLRDETEAKKPSDTSVPESLNTEKTHNQGSASYVSEKIELSEKSSDFVDEILSIKQPSSSGNSSSVKTVSEKTGENGQSHSGKRNGESSDSSNDDVVLENLVSSNVDTIKTVSVHTSISEVLNSLASPLQITEPRSLASQRSSSSSVYETLKNVNISSTTEPATQSNVVRSVVDTSGTYSESFEPDSGTSDTSEPSLIRSKLQKAILEIDTLTHQNTSNSEASRKGDALELPSPVAQSQADTPNKGSALFSTLSLLESLQKEEEIRLRHQMAVFKLHEQSLVEEARMKLASLNSEGGTNVRKKQRAILLQLREQRAHIRRLIETQNLAAQQRHLIFWQHHQLLSSTTNPSALIANRMLPSRVQSPITSRILDLSLSSSDGLESISNNPAPFKSLTKATVDTQCGEETKYPNKAPEERSGKGSEDVKEGKTSDSVAPREREKAAKKEEKKPKERYIKAPSSLKPAKRSKGSSGDCSAIEEDRSDFGKKSTSSNDGSLYTSEHEPGYSSPSGIKSPDYKNDKESKDVIDAASTGPTSTEERTDESALSKTLSKKDQHQDTLKPGVQNSIESLSTRKFDFLSSEKAKSDSEINTSGSQRADINKVLPEAKKRKEKAAAGAGSGVPFSLRFPLSPRSRLKQHRRQSSESDDSFTLSQNETASDVSDGEGKLVALRQELAARKAEVEKLKKEKRKILREKVYSQELALKNQIAAYDRYIKQTKSDIEREASELQNTARVKPLIKKPQVAGSKKLQLQDHSSLSDNSDILEESSVNESLTADQSSVLDVSFKGNEIVNSSTSSSSSRQMESVLMSEESRHTLSKSLGDETNSKIDEQLTAEIGQSHVSTADKSVEESKEDVGTSAPSVSPSQADDSEASASHDSSTETILHSPKKSLSLKGSESTPQALSEHSVEANEVVNKEAEEDYYEQTFTEVSDAQTSKQISEKEITPPLTEAENDMASTRKSVEIFLPVAEQDRSETEKESGHETTSEDICEEIPTDNSLTLSNDIEGEVAVSALPGVDSPKLSTKEIDSAKLKEKADSVADSILESLLSDSVSCMKDLLRERQKEIGEIVVHIEESADKDLKSGNEPHGRECNHLSHKEDIFVKQDSHIISSLSTQTQQNEAEKPLENLDQRNDKLLSTKESSDFERGNEMQLKKDHRINSPLESDIVSPMDGVNAEELASKLLNIQTSSSSALDDVADISETFAVSSCEGKWLEGEFWKAGEKAKSAKELREEEELLNAEIACMEEVQRFRERYPNLVIREVPDKPPPPYTPPKGDFKPFKEENTFSPRVDSPRSAPGFPEPQTPSNTISVPHRLSKADLRKIASDIINVIPSKPEEVLDTVETHFDIIYIEWQEGKDPSTVEHPSIPLQKDGADSSFDDEDEASENSETTFQRLMFHLTRELVAGVYALHTTPPQPVWFPSILPHPAKPWQVVKNLTRDNLLSYVKRKVRVFMGWDPPTMRESTMMKWARKKKEHVDQVLVHELQTEELSWTQYDEEEVHVKFQISREILTTLLEETIAIFEPILRRKLSYLDND